MKQSTSATQPKWIDTQPDLHRLVQTLSQEPLIAVDTEGDSLYSYFEKVCLIQFSTPTTDYLVDPLAIDVSELAPIFASPSIEKIFHAAEYDFLSLKRDYGFTFNNLFDTMLAARILGWKRYGLASLLAQQFQVKVDKNFQRYNWGQRPLSQKALTYAHLDTHYLIPLREMQMHALKKQRRWREAQEAFERQTLVEPTPKQFTPHDFWRIKGAKELPSDQQAILRRLYIVRDNIARKLDRPPFKVMHDRVLVEIAKTQPPNYQALKKLKGVGKKLLHHNATDILKAIQKGKKDSPPPYTSQNGQHRPSDTTLARYESLRKWRNNLAARRGVEPDVIVNNHTLMDIARRNPRTLGKLTEMGVLGDWQFETYGKPLLRALKSAT